MLGIIKEFIKFCNCNEGILSLIVSIVAIVISIKAIKAQNKATLFEKRLSLYCEIESTYSICKKILKHCNKPYDLGTKKKIMMAIFRMDSREYNIVNQALTIESKKKLEGLEKERRKLIDQYINLYISTLDSSFEDKTKLLFSDKKAVEDAIKLYYLFDSIKLAIINIDVKTIEHWMKSIKDTTEKIEKDKVLKRLAKDLPLHYKKAIIDHVIKKLMTIKINDNK